MSFGGPVPRDAVRQVSPGTPDRHRPGGAVVYDRAWLFTAPPADASVPRLRHAARDLLGEQCDALDPETLDGLLLIVSELVTNAVRHAAVLSPRITLEIALGPGWVRVAVGDDHPYRPKALERDHARTGGRGLLLVEAVARGAGGRCDVEHTPGGGKVVWAALPTAPAAGAPAAGAPVDTPAAGPRRAGG